MTMDLAAAIRVEKLSRRFGDRIAVAELSFDVKRGELFGLVGPDGAGKTTTLRMLAGVLRPSGGDAHLAGASVRHNPEQVKRTIAYMSQRFGLYADLTVRENLEFYADLYCVPRAERPARLERLFHFSNLREFQNRLAGQLSGGMKQKLGLSCALVHQPEILLLDEPTFGVDPISRRDLWLIVHEMVAEGVTAIVSTAYLDEAERFDRLALIHQGRVLAIDTPGALQESLAGELLSVRLENARGALAVVQQVPSVRRAAVFGDRLHLTVTSVERDLGPIRVALVESGYPVLDAGPLTPSLEDVFIDRVSSVEQP
ncbi:MAG: ABC transporter ATP-binding protein [Candidatus Zixiibacteriota bacterium]